MPLILSTCMESELSPGLCSDTPNRSCIMAPLERLLQTSDFTRGPFRLTRRTAQDFSGFSSLIQLYSKENGTKWSFGHHDIEYMKQSPNVVAVRIALEQYQRFTVQLLLRTFFLALPLAELLDGAAQQGLAVGFGPFLDQSWTERHVLAVDYVVAEDSNIGLTAPTALLFGEDQGKAVDLEDGAYDWHEAGEVLVEQLEVADEGEEFIDARAKHFYLIEYEMTVDGFGL